MPLPIIEVPTYTLSLLSTNEEIQYRPFLVKEEKILLIAMESENENESIKAVKQIVKNCVISDIDIDTLPMIDLEYIFIQLRAKSIGEKSDVSFNCQKEGCSNIIHTSIKLDEINIIRHEDHTNRIPITDKIGIIMKYPSFSSYSKYSLNKESEAKNYFNLLIDCVDSIYDEDQVYSHRDISRSEIVVFIEQLTQQQTKKIKKFFDTTPKIHKEITIKCDKCGEEKKIVLENFSDFFGSDSLTSP